MLKVDLLEELVAAGIDAENKRLGVDLSITTSCKGNKYLLCAAVFDLVAGLDGAAGALLII